MFIRVPLGWLDILVVLSLAATVVAGFLSLIEDSGPRKVRLVFRATILIALSITLAACDSIATRLIATRATFTGSVVSRSTSGGKSPTCDMRLVDAEGNGGFFTGGFSCHRLFPGEQVRVDFTTFNREAVSLDVMAGRDAGIHLSDSWPFQAILFFMLGMFLLYKAFAVRPSDPNDAPITDKDGISPGNGVDDQSLLHL